MKLGKTGATIIERSIDCAMIQLHTLHCTFLANQGNPFHSSQPIANASIQAYCQTASVSLPRP